ncbi:SpoIID/LytB domain-containing protein [Clostridium sp. SHJSY1]|uniref:SpoIID/LytB domain-containing protein n=1 Tax=Clostridium sp. SHJSY1 TaxID=2942483 RepID=UPI0028746CF7|nr:SpoIID/LytB domain-containing protein [Clostridium sp. SHJSY1]MDS0525986.1 SpoIID/LytB domain-containing protein [Clostridium sp. SHJSY1]
MKKRFFANFIAIVFLFTTVLVNIPQKAFAYQNSAYYNDIRIGLKSMSATSMSITLNGSYSFNGQALTSGSSYTLSINTGKIIFNGVSYDSFTLEPLNKINTITIKSGTKTYKYLGSIQFKIINGLIFPVNSLNIEEYLKGVVGAEMSDYFPLEALKSQAVSARNYTLDNIGLYNASGYDLTDTTDTQVYQGYNETYTNVIKAVNDTFGMVQLYNDTLVSAYYSASNGGYSEASENVWTTALPYLKAKADSFDNNNWPNGNITLTNAQIDSLLKSKGYLTSADKFVKLDLASITRYTSTRVSNIDVIYINSLGTETRKSFVKSRAYSFLNLPSAMYNVSYDSSTSSYLFTGKGYGHGIGLSQLGAKARAQAGQDYTTILNFYYDGSYTQSLLPTISEFNLNKTSTLVGQAVSTSTSVIGGSGSGYLYKYVVTKDSTVVFTQDYSENSSFDYSPNLDGNYNVTLYVKDKLSKNDFDKQKVVSFIAYNKPTINSLTVNNSTISVNQPINFSSIISDGSGSGYLYKYELSSNGVVLLTQDFSELSTLTYTPTTIGNYTLSLYIRDKISTETFDNTANLNFTVGSKPQIINTTFSGTLYEKRPVTMSTQAKYDNTTSPVYRFEVYNSSGILTYSQDYSASYNCVFTPATYGDYLVKVFVKSTLTDINYDDVNEYTLTIKREPVVVSTLPISIGMTGNDVTQIQTGLSNLKYKIGTIDGVFGTKTYNAVVSFQKSKFIMPTGIVDAVTLKALNDALIFKITGIK